jgi:hypothetical protein
MGLDLVEGMDDREVDDSGDDWAPGSGATIDAGSCQSMPQCTGTPDDVRATAVCVGSTSVCGRGRRD